MVHAKGGPQHSELFLEPLHVPIWFALVTKFGMVTYQMVEKVSACFGRVRQ